MKPWTTLAIAAATFAFGLTACNAPFELQPGDVVFQCSQSGQSEPIQLATNSPYSHVGMVHYMEGKPYVFEASRKVRMTPYQTWVDNGKGAHVVVKRLKDPSPLREVETMQAMHAAGEPMLGREYDRLFQWGDQTLYCSELVWKVYKRGAGIELCPPSSVQDLALDSPQVQRLIQNRYPNPDDVPWTETMVTPADLFDSPLLEEVHRAGSLP